jgi:hypothetical protein
MRRSTPVVQPAQANDGRTLTGIILTPYGSRAWRRHQRLDVVGPELHCVRDHGQEQA